MKSRIPKKVRDALEDRARIGEIVCCEICRVPANNAHHRRNQSQGGQHVLSNLMMLCGSGLTGCHGSITGNPAMSVRNGWTIQGTVAIPSETRARRRGELVLLDDLGGVTPVAAEDIPGIERGIALVNLDNKNGPGPSVDAPGEFPDLTTMEVASDR